MARTIQDAPVPEYIANEQQAVELLRLLTRKVDVDPGDLIGFDTETHGKKLPFSVGSGKPLDWMTDTVILWSLSCKLGEKYRRWCLPQQHLQLFVGLLENPRAWLAAWNAKYDGHVSWNSGVDIWQANVVDGLVMAHLYDENEFDHGLKHCSESWIDLGMTKYKDLFGSKDAQGRRIKEYETSLLDLPIDKVSDYASFDAYACLRVVEFLREKLNETPIDTDSHTLWDHFLNTEMDITKTLWRMERRGLPVDLSYFEQKIPEITERVNTLLRDINREAGRVVNVEAPAQLAQLFFSSKKDGGLGLIPIKMTPGGKKGPQASTDREVMDALKDAGVDLAVKIIQVRSLLKTRSTYLETLRDLASYYDDHRIHPNFNQHGARTGRFSTNVPNSQNFPRPDEDEWAIRSAFVAPSGCKLIVADYEQLEMRIMADRAQDPVMIDAILAGKDLHCFTVSKMSNYGYDEVKEAKKAKDRKEATDVQLVMCQLRQDMKAVGFGIIYGAGPAKISENVVISDDEVAERMEQMGEKELNKRAQRLIKKNPLITPDKAQFLAAKHSIAADKIEAYFNVFPTVRQYMADIPDLCRYHQEHDLLGNPEPKPWGFVQTLVGRYRRLVNIDHKSNWTLRGHAEREAINTTIQGTAADIVKAAMLRIEFCERLKELGVAMLNQIHDELVLEVPEENAEEAAEIVREYMEHPFNEREALCVPIPISLRICDNWAEGK